MRLYIFACCRQPNAATGFESDVSMQFVCIHTTWPGQTSRRWLSCSCFSCPAQCRARGGGPYAVAVSTFGPGCSAVGGLSLGSSEKKHIKSTCHVTYTYYDGGVWQTLTHVCLVSGVNVAQTGGAPPLLIKTMGP